MYLQASDLFNERITESGRTFRAKLTCGDEAITSGLNSIGIYGGSNNGDTITIGSTISQRIEVEMTEQELGLAGKEWKLEVGLLLDNEENIEYIPIGYFTPEKPVTDNGKTKFTAYDRMMKLSGIYTCVLPDINTITVLKDISAKTGVPINTEGLSVLSMNRPEGYTYREVLMYIAQRYGKFANVDRKGIIQFHWWTEIADYKITPGNTNGFSHDEKAYVLRNISCTTGQNEEGVAISITAGTGAQGIFISNPFMNQNELNEVYRCIGGFSYTVSSVNMPIGDIRLDPWDMIEVYDTKGNAYKVPLMTLEFQYDGGVSAAFSCVGYSETESQLDYKGPMTQFQERLEASVAKFGILAAKSASIDDLEALRIRVDKITAVDITTEYLEANYASIDDILAVSAKVNRIQSDYINTINLESKVAELGYAKIDFANVSVESVGKLFADVGLINNVTIVDGYITGVLNGVRINADAITVGTLSVDRLLVTGKDSIVYQLNVESSGLSATELEKEVYQKYLNGTDIVANSITANQIAAKTITATEIASEAITTDKLAAKAITASKINVTSLKGVTIEGLNIIGTTGNFKERIEIMSEGGEDSATFRVDTETFAVEYGDSDSGAITGYGALLIGKSDCELTGNRIYINSISGDLTLCASREEYTKDTFVIEDGNGGIRDMTRDEILSLAKFRGYIHVSGNTRDEVISSFLEFQAAYPKPEIFVSNGFDSYCLIECLEMLIELNRKFDESIRSETFSGVTTSSSTLLLSRDEKRIYIMADGTYDDNARIVFPFKIRSGYSYLRVMSLAGVSVPNTEVSGTAWYIMLD